MLVVCLDGQHHGHVAVLGLRPQTSHLTVNWCCEQMREQLVATCSSEDLRTGEEYTADGAKLRGADTVEA